MKLNLSWEKILKTVSSGDYSPEDCTPAPSREKPELIAVPFPIVAPAPPRFQWINTASDFLERHRKTALMVSSLVILGTYGPAVKDVCNIVGEVMVVNQQLNSSLRRPAWLIERRHVMDRLKARNAHKSKVTA
jgi:hypothetical protein